MKRLIPNIITLMNLACGALVLILVLDPAPLTPYENAGLVGSLMVFAMFCDLADGLAARLLKVSTELGKQLDSLADMVTFGLVPGIMVFALLRQQIWAMDFGGEMPGMAFRLWPYLGLMIPIFSALRLAKFNVDTRQTTHFRGFPTPPNAFLFLSVYVIYQIDLGQGINPVGGWTVYPPLSAVHTPAVEPSLLSYIYFPIPLSLITVLFSVLLVSNVPLLSSKLKDFSFRSNWPLYLLVGISLILLAIFWHKAVPIVIVLYFIFSFIDRVRKKP